MTPPPAPPEDAPVPDVESVLAAARERYETSVDGTLGIEEEFAICAPESLNLEPRYEELREVAIAAGLDEAIAGELLASEIEFRTGRCERWSDAVTELTDVRARVMDVARSANAVLGASATHPWADYRTQATVDLPYYRQLVERMQLVARRNNTFGLHVHVGVHGADRAVQVHDALRSLSPLLLALSGSSPFLDGEDTGMASARSVIFSRGFPRANVAPAFGTLDAYLDHLRWLMESGTIAGVGQVWWGTRPHILHGTIELRMFDGQPDVRDSLALAALSVGAVRHLCDLHDAGELPEPAADFQIDENTWRASRWGTDAVFVDLPGTGQIAADEAIGALIASARGASERHGLGLEPGLDRVEQLLAAGCSAHWQRELAQAVGESDGGHAGLNAAYRAVVDATMSSAHEPALV